MASYLITGSSRGLGLAIVKHLSSFSPTRVGIIFATARGSLPAPALVEIIQASSGRVQFVELDVNDQDSVAAAASEIEKSLGSRRGLDVLINNAGVQVPEATARQMRVADLEQTLSTNVISVHRVTSAFLPLLIEGNDKKIVNISSTLGSIGWSARSAMAAVPSYKVSKAALNMLTVQFAHELGPKGFTVLAVSPGWLQTDLGGQHAHLTAADGARATVDIIMNTEPEKDNGSFRDIYVQGSALYTGRNPPW